MYKTEILTQYFNSMRELANRCDSNIDEESVIQYVINGIDGHRSDNIILRGHLSKSCPNRLCGPRCLSCNLYGHKSFECRRTDLNNNSTPPSGVNAVHELRSPINMCKVVIISGRKLYGLVDIANDQKARGNPSDDSVNINRELCDNDGKMCVSSNDNSV
ncbi:hypothetical protein NPIL_591611 [Nephila pilipes]|uniref:Uncharacterized protein n=1 Tax=Nephila pilipes TaxID=299642 RepID=A0A8X6QQA8_NEPPI|nr:hypothetical protein NPIL_591611 [Nephila pilipes]